MISLDGDWATLQTMTTAKTKEFKQTEIGEIPADWDIVSIGNKYIFTSKPRGKMISDEIVPFLPMDMMPFNGRDIIEYLRKPGSTISSSTYFEEGDLLVSKITPCFENGKQGFAVSVPGGFGVATTEVIPLKAIPDVSDIKFLSFYLLEPNVRRLLAGKMQGATGRQRLDKSLLELWDIPFPSLPEQKRIAGVLSKIQKAVESQEKIVGDLRGLKAATIAKLFREGLRGESLKQTEIGEIPKNWGTKKLRDVADTASGGTPSRGDKQYFSGTIPWVKSGELKDREIKETKEKISQSAVDNSSAKKFPERTLLIALYGATVGKTGILGVEAATNQAVCAIFPQKNILLSGYLQSFLIQNRPLLLRARYGGAQPNISQQVIQELTLPIPSLSEQIEIVKVIDEIQNTESRASSKLSGFKELFSSTLNQLMTGKVRITE